MEKAPSRSVVELYDRVAALERREHERVIATNLVLARLASSLQTTLDDLSEQVTDLLDSLADAQVGDGASGTTNAAYEELLRDPAAFRTAWTDAHEKPVPYPGTAVAPVRRGPGSDLPFPDAPAIGEEA